MFLRLPIEPDEAGQSQTLETRGEVREGFVVGRVFRRRATDRGRIEDVVHSIDRDQQKALGTPAALLEEHDGIERNGVEHARGELRARERRIRDGRFLRIGEGRANGGATAAFAGLPADGERGIVGVLRDDGAQFEEQRRVVVAEANEVEQQLRIDGADDLLIVVGPFAADGSGPEAGGAPACNQREQTRNQKDAGPTRMLGAGAHVSTIPAPAYGPR
jgi:hypothetical protein